MRNWRSCHHVAENDGHCHYCGMPVDLDNWAAENGLWDEPHRAAREFDKAVDEYKERHS